VRSEFARCLAEHEAAHAVVAHHFGHRVHSVRIGADDSAAVWDATCASGAERAAVTAAGDLWNREFGTVEYHDLACDDLARLVRQVGVGGVWHTRRLARSVLTTRRRAVMALADRLEREHSISFDVVDSRAKAGGYR
jgi:hypothetical protein